MTFTTYLGWESDPMSRRTAEANKAIRLAWQREHDLVQVGKGTRDWTEEQQKDILDPEKGKAYDYKGRAFEGQHMKSVEKYPEYQGDPNNIQFLTKDEHLEAHQGNWQNPTNWYYDPVTKQITDFGEGMYVPCPVIELSHPVTNIAINTQGKNLTEKKTENQKTNSLHPGKNTTTNNPSQSKTSAVKTNPTNKTEKLQKIKSGLASLGTKVKSGGKIAGRFLKKHWKKIAAGGLALGLAAAEEKLRNSASGSDRDGDSPDDDYNEPNYSIPEDDNIFEYDNDLEEDDTIEDETSRSTMSPHRRRGHPHKYNTKNGIIIHMLNDIGVNGFDLNNDDSDEDDNEE